jgi:Protein of unknown function (DUF4230)
MASTEDEHDPTGAQDPWASNGPHSTVRLPSARTAPDDDVAGSAGPSTDGTTKTIDRRRGGSIFRTVKWLVAAVLVVILIIVGGIALLLPHLGNPFSAQKKDRSQPPLLLSIQDLARFEAASGNFQVIVDVQNDRKYIPDIIFSQRSLFIAAGTVDCYVDFSHLSAGNVVVSADRTSVTLNLPAPQLEPPTLDPAASYVYSDSEGLVNKLQGLFTNEPNKQQELYELADQKLAAAAVASQLAAHAEANTKSMLVGFMGALGYTTVVVNFPSP